MLLDMTQGLMAMAAILCVLTGCSGGSSGDHSSTRAATAALPVDLRSVGNERRAAEDGVVLRVAWHAEAHLPWFACRVANERDGRLYCYLEPETIASGPYSRTHWTGGTEAMATLLMEFLSAEAWRAGSPPSSGATTGDRMTLWVAAIRADSVQTASVTASCDRIRDLVRRSPQVARALSSISSGLLKQYRPPWNEGGETLFSPAP